MGMSHLCNISFREPLFLNILLYLSFLKNNINLFEGEMKRRTTNLMNLTHLNALREKKKGQGCSACFCSDNGQWLCTGFCPSGSGMLRIIQRSRYIAKNHKYIQITPLKTMETTRSA